MRQPTASICRALSLAVAGVVAACSAGAPLGSVDLTAQPSVRATAAASATPEPAEIESLTLALPTPSPTPAPAATPNWNELPVPATDAAGLAKQLAMVEAAIRDPNVTGAQLAWMGHLQQLAYGTLADYPDWKESVLAALPEKTRSAVLSSIDAGKQLRSMHGAVPKTLPDWKIVEPAPIDELVGYYKEAEEAFGVSWYYLAAIHLVETRMGRIRGLSSAGAQGPMQFMPPTWAAYGKGDVNKNHDAIIAAARYLKAAGAPGNMQKALFAYNHAQAYVNALMAYAEAMKTDPATYRGYHGWQVYYPTPDGPVLLPVGWRKG